ncbi:MAG: hypothetical protein LLG01_12545 [Planctomycetaceae bacterium]|nr:hypothetical protein [Planctomycetaceae bacterium]
MSIRNNGLHGWVMVVAMLWAGAAFACDTPVFRYAMEKWRPDPYPVVIFHKGKLTDAQQNAVLLLQKQSEDDKTNIKVDVVDFDGTVPAGAKKLFDGLTDKTLPRLVVIYEARSGAKGVLHDGPLTVEEAQAAMSSPARLEVAKRLMGGDSAVWVLLDSTDKAANEEAAKVVSAQIVSLPNEVEVSQPSAENAPSQDPEGAPGANQSPWPNKLKFSMVRLARSDPKETMFVKMLLGVEQDLAEGQYASEPVAVPVFGRGRGLYALVGKGITPDNMRKAAEFLAGACACEIKDQNPGVDMLLTADWDSAVGQPRFVEIQLPELAPLAPGQTAAPQTQPATRAAATAPATQTAATVPSIGPAPRSESMSRGGSSGRTIFWSALAALGVLLVAAGAMSLILRSRAKR